MRGTPQPGRSGTDSTARDTLDAALAPGGRATASESVDPAGRPGNTGSNAMTVARQIAEESAVPSDDPMEDMEVDDDRAAPEADMGFDGNFDVADRLGRLEPSFDDEVSTLLLNQLGSVGRSHRRESCSAARRLVT